MLSERFSPHIADRHSVDQEWEIPQNTLWVDYGLEIVRIFIWVDDATGALLTLSTLFDSCPLLWVEAIKHVLRYM